VKAAFVQGSVSDEWGVYLEVCMTSEAETVPEFRRDMYGLGALKDIEETEKRRKEKCSKFWDAEF
jgi:hypothetical protein